MKIKKTLIVVSVLVCVPPALIYGALRAALPSVDGKITTPEVKAAVTVERDALGIPTIRAGNRVDLAYATGFVHGQDRFFQLDVSRRLAAGELSEIAGEAAINQDRRTRLFRFRHVAQQVVAAADPAQQAILRAYARGVNAGLASLHARPWEYWLLRSKPAAWTPEDTVLVVYAMWWDLQYGLFQREILRQNIETRLGGKLCDSGWKCGLSFFYPTRTAWDAPDVINPARQAPDGVNDGIPTPDVLNVREATVRENAVAGLTRSPAIGSNSWAVAGRLTASGAGLLANDMHLGLRVPTTWYRARLQVVDPGSKIVLDLNGVTLPGTPFLVAGSNGKIAWGFTNSFGNWLNAQLVPCTSVNDLELKTRRTSIPLSTVFETIRVHNGPNVIFPVRSGPQGVLMQAAPEQQRCWFGSWLAQLPAATNLNLMALEQVTSTEQALSLAPVVGIPHQNFVVADRDGHIGWTVFGRIPTDVSSTRALGSSAWTTAREHPHMSDPAGGRIWTANARVTDDPDQEKLIGGPETAVGAQYILGARAQQIRDDLLRLQGPVKPADMLRIQLDDRAVFLDRWHELLLRLLDDESLQGHPQRAEFKSLVASWNGHASIESVSYRLVRAYHDRTASTVWQMILGSLQIPVTQDTEVPPQFDAPLWRLVNEQPLHMLAARYQNWRELMLSELDSTITDLQASCGGLARCTWGSHNVVSVRHPLSRALPFASWLLDMPAMPLPGDDDMPRVQETDTGASERFAVSPGHEAEGYFELPGGQSGNPVSPYYRAGFSAWVHGEQSPFLPGVTQHELTLLQQ